tara:strand:- start:434 stop:583 length:150 start_codon:yes stop_codon:yes gene_type:complete
MIENEINELLESLKNDLECDIALPSQDTFYSEEALKKVKRLIAIHRKNC